MEAPEPKPRLRPRFSLLSLLLLMAVTALSATVAMLWREVGPLRREVVRLRTETGQLTIIDPTRAYSIRIPNDDDSTWRIRGRVFLPAGTDYSLRYRGSDIPESGVVAGPNDGSPLEPGEHLFQVSLEQQREPTTGELLPFVEARFRVIPADRTGGGHSFTILVGEDRNEWIDESGFHVLSQGPGFMPQDHDPSEPLVLYRGRPFEKLVTERDAEGRARSWSTRPLQGETDGLLIWIEPQ